MARQKKTVKGRKVLRRRIVEEQVLPSKLEETIKPATWIIREFGKKPCRQASLHFIDEILYQFD